MQIAEALLKIRCNRFAVGIYNAPGFFALRCGNLGLISKLNGWDAVYI